LRHLFSIQRHFSHTEVDSVWRAYRCNLDWVDEYSAVFVAAEAIETLDIFEGAGR
jgi:hypothetical protein